MKRALIAGLAALSVMGMAALPAMAETYGPETFGAPFVVSDPFVGANGWTYTDGSARDVELVASGIDGPSIRMSNAVMDSSFSNWVFSKPLVTPAVEDADGNEFVAEFDIKSATGAYQPGLQISVAPQTSGGARMSFLKFIDRPDGIAVQFADYENDGVNNRQFDIATGLTYEDAHHVKIVLDLYAGPNNDVAQVFIDNEQPRIPNVVTGFEGFFAPVDHPDTFNKLKAGQSVPMKWKIGSVSPATTWEDYYRFNPESNAGVDPEDWTTRQVDSLIFQARQGSGPATQAGVDGFGYFIDDVEYSSLTTATLPNPSSTPGDPSIYTQPIFTAKQIVCPGGADIDELEQVDTPGASHLTYDAASGVWHYNWQTTKTMKNTCVKLTLNLTGDYALFKIVK